MTYACKSHTITSATSYWLHGLVLLDVGGGYTGCEYQEAMTIGEILEVGYLESVVDV